MKALFWLQSKEAPCWAILPGQIEKVRRALPGWELISAENKQHFLSHLGEADAVAVWNFEQSWFPLAPKLKLLKTPAAGLDYFSVTSPRGVCFEGSAFHGPLMAETALGWLLSHSRRIAKSAQAMRLGPPWPRWDLSSQMRTLRGSRLTILGFGAIGSEIGRVAALLGCRVSGIRRTSPARGARAAAVSGSAYPSWFDPDFRKDELFYTQETPLGELLEKLLPKSDHFLISLPGGTERDNLIGFRELSLLPRGAGIYNIGRGNVLEEGGLCRHLSKDPEAEAYLDVFCSEPLPAGSPLRSIPNAYLMPHISAAAPDYLDLFIQEFIGSIQREC